MKKGRLIAIEGLDGSGKATQAKLLAEALSLAGHAVRAVSFPDYASESSALVRLYLSGSFGTRPDDVNAYAASTFYAVDRYASYKRDWGPFYDAGGIVVADRYTTSNAVHQCAKLPQSEWSAYLDWLFSFEYTLLGLPAPDNVIYLRVERPVSRTLLLHRYGGDVGCEDIHELDDDYQSRAERAAAYCCKNLGWTVVECVRDGAMRAVEDIHREVVRMAEW